ncbi:MAG: HAD-IIA family hydrolase [Actinomycetota bacterium]|nr:HAD-IIA family hydrolase [Actinomycetota bacterium]
MSSSGPAPLAAAAHLLERYAAFAIDLDGVVWRGESIIEGAIEGLQAIKATGRPFVLLTNNGSYIPELVVDRLAEAGFDMPASRLLTSTIATRRWITEHGLAGESAFAMGPNLEQQLQDLMEVRRIEPGAAARVVVVGRDEEFTYLRMKVAADSIRAGGAFVALNKDPIMPVHDGVVPGTGSIVAALEAASGAKATIIGKPQEPMMQAAADLLGAEPVLMIGDRIESDIAGARRMGWDGAIVLTGLTKTLPKETKPDYVLSSLGALAREKEELRVQAGSGRGGPGGEATSGSEGEGIAQAPRGAGGQA